MEWNNIIEEDELMVKGERISLEDYEIGLKNVTSEGQEENSLLHDENFLKMKTEDIFHEEFHTDETIPPIFSEQDTELKSETKSDLAMKNEAHNCVEITKSLKENRRIKKTITRPSIMSKRSQIWKFYIEVASDPSTVICKLCLENISRGGKIARNFNTTNMRKHLRVKHFNKFKECIESNNSVNDAVMLLESSNLELEVPESQHRGESSVLSIAGPNEIKNWISGDKTLGKKQPWESTRPKEEKAVNMQPFSIVGGIGSASVCIQLLEKRKITRRNIMSKRSQIWKYYTEVAGDPSTVTCQLCFENISRGGKIAKNFNTTNMRNHLRVKHFSKFKELTETNNSVSNAVMLLESSDLEMEGRVCQHSGEPSVNSVASPNGIKKQISLDATLLKKQQWESTHPKAVEITKAIGEMIAVDIQPFSMVEDIGFKRLLMSLCPNYVAPSCKYMTEVILPIIYEKMFNKVKISVSKAKYISLTTNIWTATIKNTSFISLTGHWLDEDFHQHVGVLSILPFTGEHTSCRISESIINGLDYLEIPAEKVHIVLKDNIAHMKAGIRESGLESIGCFITSLQICVTNSIFSQVTVNNMINVCRMTATHFDYSPSASNKLVHLQKRLGIAEQTLKPDVPTRWNSTFYMLQSMCEQRQPLILYAKKNKGISLLTGIQWDLAVKLVALLQPFEEITRSLRRRASTSAEIIPAILALNVALNIAENSLSGIKIIINEFKKSMQERFDHFLTNQTLCLSTFLDPRFKFLIQTENKMIDISKITEWLCEIIAKKNEKKLIPQPESPSSSEEESVKGNSKGLTLIKLSDCFNILMKRSEERGLRQHEDIRIKGDVQETKPAHISTRSGKGLSASCSVSVRLIPLSKKRASKRKEIKFNVEKEIGKYLSTPALPKYSDDPFLWWQVNKESLPKLSEMALKYLSAPPSSVESEILLSTADIIYDVPKNRLSSTNAEKLMFLHYNLRHYEFKY